MSGDIGLSRSERGPQARDPRNDRHSTGTRGPGRLMLSIGVGSCEQRLAKEPESFRDFNPPPNFRLTAAQLRVGRWTKATALCGRQYLAHFNLGRGPRRGSGLTGMNFASAIARAASPGFSGLTTSFGAPAGTASLMTSNRARAAWVVSSNL